MSVLRKSSMFGGGVEYGSGHIALNNVSGVLSWLSGGDA